jgi:hypothetical protein
MNFNFLQFIMDYIRHGCVPNESGNDGAIGVRVWADRGEMLSRLKQYCPRTRSAVAVCLLFLDVQPSLFAQASSGHGGVQFRTLGFEVSPDDLFYSLDGKDTALRIFDSVRSGFHPYPKGGEIRFYRIILKEDGTRERVVVARGDLTDRGPTPLLLLTKNKMEPDKLDITVIPDDLTAFPEQTCRFVNFTQAEIGVTVGAEESTVIPGGIRLVDTHLGEDENTRFVSTFVTISDDKLMLSYNNWVFRPGQRVMVLISVSENGKPRVVRLIDAVAPLRSIKARGDPR